MMTQKHLSYSAILVLAANTMNGPGITTLPNVAVDAGLFLYIFLIAISVKMASFVCTRMVNAMWSSLSHPSGGEVGYERVKRVESEMRLPLEEGIDEIIPTATMQLAELAHSNQLLEHRDHKCDPQSNFEEENLVDEVVVENESLLDHHKINGPYAQPELERTSIVGQSLEGYGRKTTTVVALTMVASALW